GEKSWTHPSTLSYAVRRSRRKRRSQRRTRMTTTCRCARADLAAIRCRRINSRTIGSRMRYR
ncbi:hypothetical protein LTR16_012369, partial [Cryomyces antarcticus]